MTIAIQPRSGSFSIDLRTNLYRTLRLQYKSCSDVRATEFHDTPDY